MRIYDLRDRDGRLRAFEVDNTVLGRRGVAAILERLPGVRLVRRSRLFSSFREEEFCEFEVDGVRFAAWEPFGDSSRFWIGPEQISTRQTEIVRAAFAAYLSARWLLWAGRLAFGLAAFGLTLIFLGRMETWAFGTRLGFGFLLAGGIPSALIWLAARHGMLRT